MFKIIIICLALLVPTASTADDYVGVQASKYAWGSKRMDRTIWGIARADLDGNGTKETVLLEADRIWMATTQGNEFVETAVYKFPSYTQGLRIYTIDIDGNGADEIVVSAVRYGNPASMILARKGMTFIPVIASAPWHLRVENNVLVGQRWSRDHFFEGKLYELGITNGRLAIVKKLERPRWARIFNHTSVPTLTDNPVLVSLEGYNPLRAYEGYPRKKDERKWKKFWTSSGRFGGTILYVHREVRQPLADLPEYNVPIQHEPVIVTYQGKPGMIAPKNDMPLKNVIGSKQLIRGGRLIAFVYDDAMGFQEVFMTERMPGFIADYVYDQGPDGAKLYVALQGEPEAFNPNPQSSVLVYQLSSPPPAPLAEMTSTETTEKAAK